MPNHEIRITEAAYDDLLSIVEYIANDNSIAAPQLTDEIEQRIEALKDFPEMGIIPKLPRLANKGYRILIINDYLVFYVKLDEVVEIRRIVSGKRDYARTFS